MTRVDPQIDNSYRDDPMPGVPATDFSARWSGTVTVPKTGTYTFGTTSDDGARLKVDGKTVIDDWSNHGARTRTAEVALTAGSTVEVQLEYYNAGSRGEITLGWLPPGVDLAQQAADLAGKSDVAIVYSSVETTEGRDLENIDLPAEDNALIAKVAAANKRTIVVLNTGSAVTMPWLDQVQGVLEAWYPGQQSGNAIADVLFGDVNPSAKLPVTFPASMSQLPTAAAERFPGVDGKVQYSEQRQVGYRWYDAQDLTPLFPFGFGLSYTSFRLSDLKLGEQTLTPEGTLKATATVTNTGDKAGTETVQAYLAVPDPTGKEPPRHLVGVARATLEPGESKQVSIDINGKDASIWNTEAQQWQLQPGRYTVSVGNSSADLPLTAGFTVHQSSGPLYTSVEAPEQVAAGTVEVDTSFTNLSDAVVRDASTALNVPDGWSATPTSAAKWPTVAPGRTVTTRWRVTVPDGVEPGQHRLTAATTSTRNRTPDAPATVKVPFGSLASVFDTVAVTSDADPGPGDFDGAGYSYSAEGLATAGVVPGAPVEGGFTWPAAEPGTPNAALAGGQVVKASGSGSTFGLLGAADNGTASGSVTVTYTDGTTSTGTVTFGNWAPAKAVPGCTLAAVSPTWNRPEGSTKPKEVKVGVYASTVPLTPGKQVASVTLPTVSNLHLFDLSITD